MSQIKIKNITEEFFVTIFDRDKFFKFKSILFHFNEKHIHRAIVQVWSTRVESTLFRIVNDDLKPNTTPNKKTPIIRRRTKPNPQIHKDPSLKSLLQKKKAQKADESSPQAPQTSMLSISLIIHCCFILYFSQRRVCKGQRHSGSLQCNHQCIRPSSDPFERNGKTNPRHGYSHLHRGNPLWYQSICMK